MKISVLLLPVLLALPAFAGMSQTIPPALLTPAASPSPSPAASPAASPSNGTVTMISTLPVVISKSGNYMLAGDLSATSSPAISITANQVTLDMNGRSLTASGAAASTGGIGISVTSQEVVIENGDIESFGLAGVLLNNTNTSATPAGGSNTKVVLRDLLMNNNLFGVFSIGGRLNRIQTCIINGGSVGVLLSGDSGTEVNECQIGYQATSGPIAVGYGVFSVSGKGIIVESTTLASPQTAGLFLGSVDQFRFCNFLSNPVKNVGGTNNTFN